MLFFIRQRCQGFVIWCWLAVSVPGADGRGAGMRATSPSQVPSPSTDSLQRTAPLEGQASTPVRGTSRTSGRLYCSWCTTSDSGPISEAPPLASEEVGPSSEDPTLLRKAGTSRSEAFDPTGKAAIPASNARTRTHGARAPPDGAPNEDEVTGSSSKELKSMRKLRELLRKADNSSMVLTGVLCTLLSTLSYSGSQMLSPGDYSRRPLVRTAIAAGVLGIIHFFLHVVSVWRKSKHRHRVWEADLKVALGLSTRRKRAEERGVLRKSLCSASVPAMEVNDVVTLLAEAFLRG